VNESGDLVCIEESVVALNGIEMITQEDVRLADLAQERQKKITDIRLELLKETKAEEDRREAWAQNYYAKQGAIRAAESELEKCGQAAIRIYQEVPLELRTILSQAQAKLRGYAEELDRARQELEAAKAVFERRKDEAKHTGFKLEKNEIEAHTATINLRMAAHKEKLDEKAVLEASVKKAQIAVDVEIKRIRASAKK
jgi:hypothetical protein